MGQARRSIPSLLERAAELDVVARAVSGATGGDGRTVLVEGPAGIGKTSLLAASEAGGTVTLHARGAPLEQDFAWGVVRQLFEGWLGEQPDHERRRLLGGAAEPAGAALGHAPTHDERPFAAIHGLYWLALNAAERQPLTLVVDDAHWCDDASLRWLAYLSQRVEGAPIALLLGVRRPDPGAEREPFLQMAAYASTAVLQLAPLTAGATHELVANRLTSGDVPRIAGACHEATGGNPFLLWALLDDLAGLPPGRPPDPGTIGALRPEAISRAVLLRMGALTVEAHAAARAIAVLGGSATTSRVAALARQPPELTTEALLALGSAGVLADVVPPAFIHPIVHTVVLDDLMAPERSAWHGRAAALLRETGGTTDEIAAQLMRTEPAADAAAVTDLTDAAKGALARGAPEGAVGLAERALREPPSPDAVAGLERLRGRALLRARGAEGLEALRAAMDAAEESGERADSGLELARALEGLSRNPEATVVYEQLLRELEGSDDGRARELEAGLVVAAAQHLSTLPRGMAALAAGLERSPQDDAAASILKATLAVATAAAGSQDCVPLAEEALRGGHLLDAEPSIAVGLAASALTWGGRLDSAVAVWDEVVERAVGNGEPLRLAFALTFRGGVQLRAGRLADAEADLSAALDVPHEMWADAAVPVDTLALLGETLLERKGPAAAGSALDDLGDAGDLSDYQGNNPALMARGRIRLASGHADEAAADLLELGRRCELWTLRNPAAFPWRSWAAIALRGSDPVRAQELAGEELELARTFGAPAPLGVAMRAAGLIRGGDDGVELLEGAVEQLASSAARLEHARALVDLGAAHRRAGRREAARARLAEGLDRAVMCGAGALADHARAELKLAGARPRRDRVSGRDALTPSELRVVRIAVEGRSNREIAEQLWVTPKTVETHLGRAYRKLGIKTRAELKGALSEQLNVQGGDPDVTAPEPG